MTFGYCVHIFYARLEPQRKIKVFVLLKVLRLCRL